MRSVSVKLTFGDSTSVEIMLCNFSHEFPGYVARFMDVSRGMRRRFREETITDMMMAGLAAAGVGRVIVDFPNEIETGADMEWNFVDQTNNRYFRVFIQAKRIYGEGQIWSRLNYKELFHKTGSVNGYQAIDLAKAAANEPHTYPYYTFYNSQKACDLAAKGNARGSAKINGVMLADGHLVARRVQDGVASNSERKVRSLATLAPIMQPLTCLFCPSTLWRVGPLAFSPGRLIYFAMGGALGRGVGIPLPPTPHQIRDRIAAHREADDTLLELPPVPHVGETIPDYVQDIIGRRGRYSAEGEAASPSRRRIVFLSRSEFEEDEVDGR